MNPRSWRLLYNQDCTNLFAVTGEPLTPAHVDRMVDEVADGGADVFLVNPNAQRVNYPSRVWQTFWDGYAPGRRAFFGPVPDADVRAREAWVRQMQHLAEQGCDYLARALARCRARGITPGATIRMNDMHDVPWSGSHLFSRFYLDHPELHLHNPPACGWSATGLNYEHAAVREHYLTLIREVASYDIEILELDFLRFHCYFPRAEFARHAEIMTGFVRDVRRILDGTGRRIALVPRVATNPAAALELGCDVAAWARQGLIDGLTTAAFLQVCWHLALDEFRPLLGPALPLYAGTDFMAARPDGLPGRQLPIEPELMRGFAAGALAAGADGVNFFNFFCAREGSPRRDPLFAEIAGLRPGRLPGTPQTYLLSTGWGQAEVDGAPQLPAALAPGQPHAFWLWAAAVPETQHVTVAVTFAGDAPPADSLWLQVNHLPAGHAEEIGDVPGTDPTLRTACFAVPAAALRDGRNTLVLRSEATPVTVRLLALRTAPD